MPPFLNRIHKKAAEPLFCFDYSCDSGKGMFSLLPNTILYCGIEAPGNAPVIKGQDIKGHIFCPYAPYIYVLYMHGQTKGILAPAVSFFSVFSFIARPP